MSKRPLGITMMPLGGPSISKDGSQVGPDAQIVALHLRLPLSHQNVKMPVPARKLFGLEWPYFRTRNMAVFGQIVFVPDENLHTGNTACKPGCSKYPFSRAFRTYPTYPPPPHRTLSAHKRGNNDNDCEKRSELACFPCPREIWAGG